MTKIDFYLLDDNGLADDGTGKSRFACRLTQKVFSQGYKIFIYADDQSLISKMDNLLWTFQPGSFLPHGINENKTTEPIVLGDAEPPETIHDVLINLASTSPDFFSSFDRVAEIVGSSESEKLGARERYRFYRDRGYELETHHI
ncbi:MAG: DNA polymerase III subunit chi [Acidiferrobacterales bacterium]